LTFRSRFAPLFVASPERAGARSHAPSMRHATVLAHPIFIPALASGGCAEIILNAV
jgi:hypothetical protein